MLQIDGHPLAVAPVGRRHPVGIDQDRRIASCSRSDADQIIVLEDGRVVGRGRHTDLLEMCETYAEIVASQTLEAVQP